MYKNFGLKMRNIWKKCKLVHFRQCLCSFQLNLLTNKILEKDKPEMFYRHIYSVGTFKIFQHIGA